MYKIIHEHDHVSNVHSFLNDTDYNEYIQINFLLWNFYTLILLNIQ